MANQNNSETPKPTVKAAEEKAKQAQAQAAEEKINPKQIEAVRVIAAIPITVVDAKDNDIVWDLGCVKITAGCVREAQKLMGL